jgi:hypothetical protein
MPYLNWSEARIQISTSTLSPVMTQLTLELGSQEIQSLAQVLDEVFSGQSSELRLSLSQEWVLFWKKREDGSRALLAHPQEKEWVGTLALESGEGEKWSQSLKALNSGQAIHLSHLVRLATVSNLDLVIHRQA